MKIDLKALPTRSWRSHALFRAGISAAARGDHGTAESLFIESLRDDPKNDAARVNLAGELMVDRDDNPTNDRFAIEFAVEQLEIVRKSYDDKKPLDEIYYAALYRLATARYDLEQLDDAIDIAKQLDSDLCAAIRTCRSEHPDDPLDKRRHERSKAYYEQNYPAAKIMLIGMQLERGDPGIDLTHLSKAADVPVPTAQFQYNYACALAVHLPQKDNPKLEAEAIQRLRLAIRMKEDLRARAKVDRSLRKLHGNKEYEALFATVPPQPEGKIKVPRQLQLKKRPKPGVPPVQL